MPIKRSVHDPAQYATPQEMLGNMLYEPCNLRDVVYIGGVVLYKGGRKTT
jgi:hypothetical protein